MAFCCVSLENCKGLYKYMNTYDQSLEMACMSREMVFDVVVLGGLDKNPYGWRLMSLKA